MDSIGREWCTIDDIDHSLIGGYSSSFAGSIVQLLFQIERGSEIRNSDDNDQQ